MYEKIKVGDVVQLVGGSRRMTVVDDDAFGDELDPDVLCCWHDDAGVSHREVYPARAVRAEPH